MPDVELKDMRLTNAEREEASTPVATDDRPRYPYELSMYLGDEVLDKLGLESLPDVGTHVPIAGLAEVVGVGQSSSEDGTRRNINLQIVSFGVGSPQSADAAERLYGDGDGEGGDA